MSISNPAWRFNPPADADGSSYFATIPQIAVNEFIELIFDIANQGSRWNVIEHFKGCFGSSGTSSNESWAETDLIRVMEYQAQKNAVLFLESFINGCEKLASYNPNWAFPDQAYINRLLSKHNIGYLIKNSVLILRDSNSLPIPVPVETPSMLERARMRIHESLNRSEELLGECRTREAVQEVLWLLESVSNSFQDLELDSGKIEGKYFTRIVDDLRKHHKGSNLDNILLWVKTMHGYLSAPKGGGVRHGTDLNKGVELELNEARLFCNLTRSYITFLLAEYEKLTRRNTLLPP